MGAKRSKWTEEENKLSPTETKPSFPMEQLIWWSESQHPQNPSARAERRGTHLRWAVSNEDTLQVKLSTLQVF